MSMRAGENERVRGTAAQALLDRGWGKPKVEVVTDEKQDYIAALQAVNECLRQGNSSFLKNVYYSQESRCTERNHLSSFSMPNSSRV